MHSNLHGNFKNFAQISGLKCHIDKSMIMIIGTDIIPEFVANSGFIVTNSLKILGFEITEDFRSLTENFTGVIAKLEKTSAVLEPVLFKLSRKN
jgi:hypothetical protein